MLLKIKIQKALFLRKLSLNEKILLIIYLISIPNISYAYLDPGMGSYILAMLAAFFAALMAFFNVILEK